MKLLLVIFIVFSTGFAAKLPPNFKRCHLKDSVCLKNAVQDALPRFKNGLPEYGLPPSDPLLIPEIVIEAGEKVVQFKQTYRNALLLGMSTGTVSDFEMDLEKGKIIMGFKMDQLILTGKYAAEGKILLIPINSKGDFEITLDKPVSTLTFDIEVFTKNNVKHLRGTAVKLELEAQHASYKFGNLFGENKEISDNLSKVLNENWKTIFDELVPSYTEAYGKVMMQMMNRLFAKVPLSEIFLDQ